MKYVVVTGGVVSGLGKGVTISSLGRLLQGCGHRVTSIKIDPYLNVDAGTMSPFEHGEVFVLNDGGESDLDLGNYERFLDIELTSDHNITTGKMYRNVIAKERRGDFLGKTVQVVPHITNEIQDTLERVAHIPTSNDASGEPAVADICLIEVGGTVGDIESSVFLEALRQFQFRVGHENFCLCFVSLVPLLGGADCEQKTKPTQHGVRELRGLGLTPQVIFCRCPQPLLPATKHKISSFCHVPSDQVLSVHDVNNVYHVPLLLQQQNLHLILAKELKLAPNDHPDMRSWSTMAHDLDSFTIPVSIALIGKYTGLQDSYLSVIKALKHAAIACERDLKLIWIDATHLEDFSDAELSIEEKQKRQEDQDAAWLDLKGADGVIVPGGFGNRGFEGKLKAAEHCRVHKKPYLGVCLGFQAMVVEYARNVMGWTTANSTEFDESTEHPAVIFMPEVDPTKMGGTMRLGERTTQFLPSEDDSNNDKPILSSKIQKLYGSQDAVQERHRHRYEVNPELAPIIHDAGLKFVGRDTTGTRMQVAELDTEQHPYYVACQYHPEFKSRPLHPSPPFHGLVLASSGQLTKHLSSLNDS